MAAKKLMLVSDLLHLKLKSDTFHAFVHECTAESFNVIKKCAKKDDVTSRKQTTTPRPTFGH